METGTLTESYTVDDYRQWEGDWELIKGVAHPMAPSPTVLHQQVGFALSVELARALEHCPQCQALYETDVELSRDTVVRPDVQVICYTPQEDRLTRAPELVFEIVSTKSARRDEHIKFELYRSEAVAYFVLVYPEPRKAKVFRLIDGEYRKAGDFTDEQFRFDLSRCAVEVDFSALWRRKG